MDPARLIDWETVLQSPVAVSLLLLAALFVVWAVLIGWAISLMRRHRELERETRDIQREWRDYLMAERDLDHTLRSIREILSLQEVRGARMDQN